MSIVLKYFTIGLWLVVVTGPAVAAERVCTYRTWEWDTLAKKAINPRLLSKPRRELSTEERGPINGCSVCAEDQVEVRLDGVPPFQICRAFGDRIRRAIAKARAEGFPILSVVGYRVGKSKGPLNAAGVRTQFSNHSYGTAIDFNADKNGLYDHCAHFDQHCQLRRGGEYRPHDRAALTKASSLYRALKDEGFKWGGEIQGKQKDFMHFSMTGM